MGQQDSAIPAEVYQTQLGAIYAGNSIVLMRSMLKPHSIDLILTSPPYALVRKKAYGNPDADRYLAWFGNPGRAIFSWPDRA